MSRAAFDDLALANVENRWLLQTVSTSPRASTHVNGAGVSTLDAEHNKYESTRQNKSETTSNSIRTSACLLLQERRNAEERTVSRSELIEQIKLANNGGQCRILHSRSRYSNVLQAQIYVVQTCPNHALIHHSTRHQHHPCPWKSQNPLQWPGSSPSLEMQTNNIATQAQDFASYSRRLSYEPIGP